MADAAAFERLLLALMAPDDATRKQGEAALSGLRKEQPDFLLQHLLQATCTNAHANLRGFAALLLRQSCEASANESKRVWLRSSDAARVIVQRELLNAMKRETSNAVRHQLYQTVGGLGTSADVSWPELLPALFASAAPDAAAHERSGAFTVFGHLAERIASEMTDMLPSFAEMFAAGLAAPAPSSPAAAAAAAGSSSAPPMCAALGAVCQLLNALRRDSERTALQPLLPTMLNALTTMLQMGLHDEAVAALEKLVDLAGEHAKFFAPCFGDLLGLAVAVVGGSSAVDTGVRWLMLELIVSITEGAPVLARKLESDASQPSVVRSMLPVVMRVMLDVYEPDDPHWATGADEDDGEVTGLAVGSEAMYRIAISIRTKKFLPTASELIVSYATRPEWQARHCALIALSSIGDVIPDSPEQRRSVIAPALSALADAHPRVRWAATHAVGQLANDLAPMLQEELHSMIVPPLVELLVRDVASPRVRAHALAAMAGVMEHMTRTTLRPYLQPLLECLLRVLQESEAQTPLFVKEAAVTLIGTCAQRAEEEFGPFYAAFMPSLVGIFCTAPPAERDAYRAQRLFRCLVLECLSLIGVACGKATFATDAQTILRSMVEYRGHTLETDDPTGSYMLQAWARIGGVLGADFAPYLPMVVPDLVAAAVKSPMDYIVGDLDEDDDDFIFTSPEQQEDGTTRHLVMRTSAVEDKSTACRMLLLLAQDVKEHFAPYVEQVVSLFNSLLHGDCYFEDIRVRTSECNARTRRARRNSFSPLILTLSVSLSRSLFLSLSLSLSLRLRA